MSDCRAWVTLRPADREPIRLVCEVESGPYADSHSGNHSADIDEEDNPVRVEWACWSAGHALVDPVIESRRTLAGVFGFGFR
jgi:hypothetical protein